LKSRFTIIWIGKTKERFVEEGIKKYRELLSPYAKLIIKTIKEEKGGSTAEHLKREAKKILSEAERYILLDEKGRLMSSQEFAEFLSKRRETVFVVGGPYGVDKKVKENAEMLMSLSPMTFPHELARLILLEQIYRAMTIIRGRGYHH
jgi:23S rRNA (pseudouridine1915-N3)-methyltransferase